MVFVRRPPPLQLDSRSLFDTSIMPETPPRSSVFAKMYRLNWRMLVIAVAVLNAVRFLFSAAQNFQDASIDHAHGFNRLYHLSVALGVMYTISCLIDIYGAFSASMQQLSLLRIYTFLACISAMLVTVCGMSSILRYFMLAEDVLNECASLALAGLVPSKSTFRGHLWPIGIISSSDEAASKCANAWANASTSQITVDFLLFHILPAVFQIFIVIVYHTQIRCPDHAASLLSQLKGNGNVQMDVSHATSYSPLYATAATAGFGRSADRAEGGYDYNNARGGAMQGLLKKTVQRQQPGNGKAVMKQIQSYSNNGQRASFAGAWVAAPAMPVARHGLPNANVGTSHHFAPMTSAAAMSATVAPGPPSFSVPQDGYGAFAHSEYDVAGFE